MKITRKQLRRIIQEEKRKLLKENPGRKVVATYQGEFYFDGNMRNGYTAGEVIDQMDTSGDGRRDILALEILRDLGYTIEDRDEPDNPSDIGEYIKAVYGR